MLLSKSIVPRIFRLSAGFIFGVRHGTLADAVSFYENLGLQKLLCRSRFTLHVVDDVIDFNVRIKTEDHFV